MGFPFVVWFLLCFVFFLSVVFWFCSFFHVDSSPLCVICSSPFFNSFVFHVVFPSVFVFFHVFSHVSFFLFFFHMFSCVFLPRVLFVSPVCLVRFALVSCFSLSFLFFLFLVVSPLFFVFRLLLFLKIICFVSIPSHTHKRASHDFDQGHEREHDHHTTRVNPR